MWEMDLYQAAWYCDSEVIILAIKLVEHELNDT